ncbi:MAG: glucose 1-dehydrogenase [Chloroflexi bacterium]|nr:glucose 1-dehydrogenase [Chloroflexota bacterium]
MNEYKPPPHPQEIFDFTGKVALVTGSGSGIGAGIAWRFAEAGADVIIHYLRSQEGAEGLAARITATGRRALAIQADLTRQADVAKLINAATTQIGALDVVINNAGIYPLHSVIEMAENEWDSVIDANLRSVFLCTQAAARSMIAAKMHGVIINLASIEAHNPAPLHSHYNAAKAGVVMYTRSSANELGPHGIRVNSVSPGLIWRHGLDQDWPDGVARYRKGAPLGRLGRAEDIADACLFLASPGARWITGIDLVVDGGILTKQIF